MLFTFYQYSLPFVLQTHAMFIGEMLGKKIRKKENNVENTALILLSKDFGIQSLILKMNLSNKDI